MGVLDTVPKLPYAELVSRDRAAKRKSPGFGLSPHQFQRGVLLRRIEKELPVASPIDAVNAYGTTNLDELIRQVQAGCKVAAGVLEKSVRAGLRWYFTRHPRIQGMDDHISSLTGAVMEAVASGQLCSACELSAFTRTQALRALTALGAPALAGEPSRPEVKRMKEALAQLPPRQREAMTRYYEGQSAERICADLDLASSELMLLKEQLRSSYSPQKRPAARESGVSMLSRRA